MTPSCASQSVKHLNQWGYKAITAANGTEGVEKAILHKPDLVLLDVMMPDIAGPRVAKILRHHPVTKDIPIIAMSAGLDFRVRKSCLNAGCDDCIAKPFTYEVLEEKLSAFLISSQREN